MTDLPIVQVEAARTFTRDLRTLAKKYRSIYQDVQPMIEELQNGNIIGDQIPNIGYMVFKVRIRNTDIQKGKSGGYRLIYYLQTTTGIILLTIYPKSEHADIAAGEIRAIIEQEE
ncbi:MAG: type II toxin-antitoxin system RelE/ParE family toxin [Aphanocapsa sp. GSE-SYN-MK-11-07L]|jgi:mRNA-degrading endonuclease RelE of RelBE toxin-antitoxin system|nr:type II toxin-antitoxin system RelE/ParE family toxin [Aphanocapsa sp. GSE-SYN-MK-11-07L]